MSNVTVLRSERADVGKARDYLGPAEVAEVSPAEILVRLPSGSLVPARPAMAFTYEPAAGDVVLVIGNAEGHYVIGVLQGTGRAVLSFPGDIEINAVNGVLDLGGDKGVRIRSSSVEVQAGKLRFLAETVVQKFSSLRQHVSDLLSVRAGQSHTVVDGAQIAQSKSSTILTEEKVTINGKSIHLG